MNEHVTAAIQVAIPVIVPILIAAAKAELPKLPAWTLPILAPALGALLDWISQLAGANTGGPLTGAILGSAGVGLRELKDQVHGRISNLSTPPPTLKP